MPHDCWGMRATRRTSRRSTTVSEFGAPWIGRSSPRLALIVAMCWGIGPIPAGGPRGREGMAVVTE